MSGMGGVGGHPLVGYHYPFDVDKGIRCAHTSFIRSSVSFIRTGTTPAVWRCLLTPTAEHHRSKLIFAVDPVGSCGTPQIDQLHRVREPVSRSKAGVQGKVADVVHRRSRHAESQNELKAFQILIATARADSWQVILEPFGGDRAEPQICAELCSNRAYSFEPS